IHLPSHLAGLLYSPRSERATIRSPLRLRQGVLPLSCTTRIPHPHVGASGCSPLLRPTHLPSHLAGLLYSPRSERATSQSPLRLRQGVLPLSCTTRIPHPHVRASGCSP